MTYSILIVEDDPSIAELLKMTLIGSGYNCIVASNGNTAIQEIEHQKYQLALLDITLPDMEGYEAVPYFQAKNIPIIFITASDSIYPST